MHWLNKPSSPQYQDAMQLMLTLGKNKKIENWLVNFLPIGQISIESINWMYEHWYPHFLELPTKKYACVAPTDIYYLLALENMFDYRKQTIHFDFQFFSDMQVALEWVRETMPISVTLGP